VNRIVPEPSPSPSDGTLIAAVLAGDKERFAELVGRYQGALTRAARSRLGRSDWAEDVVQETFLCAFRWLSGYDSRYSFRTWIWTILFNQIHRHLKKHTRTPRVNSWCDQTEQNAAEHQRLADPPGREEAPPEQALAAESSRLLESVLTQLPEPQADALRLRFFGGLKFEEIADAMQCSHSTAKNRVRWGLLKMSALLQADAKHRSVFDCFEQNRHETND
jgi:RNA polymerase sigma-70 factor (ECF subfamily)